MNNWILPHVKEEIDQLNKERELQQEQHALRQQLEKPVNYVVLDAALWNGDIDKAFKLCLVHVSLFATRGAEHNLDSVAPYLFSYTEDSGFAEWIKAKSEAGLRVLYLCSDESLEGLRKHLHRFLRVKTESGKWLFFRFYDPDVAEIALPYLTEEQQFYFYAKIKYVSFIKETTKKDILLFPSGKIRLRTANERITTYPLLIFTPNLLKQISEAKVNVYKEELFLYLSKDENLNTASDLNLSEFIHKSVDEAMKWGFRSEKECFDYILLSLEYRELLREPKTKEITDILGNKQYNTSQK